MNESQKTQLNLIKKSNFSSENGSKVLSLTPRFVKTSQEAACAEVGNIWLSLTMETHKIPPAKQKTPEKSFH